jgi:hypothetical protein
MPGDARPVPYDPDGILWQLAGVCDSRDPALRFNERIELVLPPPSREARSPQQSRRGLERERLARTWRAGDHRPWWPDPPAEPSLPSSTALLLPFQTQQRWSDPPDPPPNLPPPPNPPPPPPRRAALAPLDPNAQTLVREVRALEKENLCLRKHVLLQDRALVALAKLRQRPEP